MTVQNTIVKNVYVGNGSTTVFPFTFECNKAEHIQAFVKDAAGNISSTTNFKVDLEQKNLTYPNTGEPLAKGDKLIILRQLPLQQLLNLLNQGPFYAEDIEETFDEVVMMLQQMTERIGRSLAVSIDIDAENTFNTIIPLEAGKTFRVKDDGTGFEVTEDPGKVIDGAKALLKLTTEQAELAKEQADASSQSAVNAQNAAAHAEVQAASVKKYKALWFDSVAAMKAEPSLTAGAYVNTAGYYEPNDGGGASYLIRAKTDSDVDDGDSLHQLSNGLIAELLHNAIERKIPKHIEDYKHQDDGDYTEAFKRFFADVANGNKISLLLSGVYNISESITVPKGGANFEIVGLGRGTIVKYTGNNGTSDEPIVLFNSFSTQQGMFCTFDNIRFETSKDNIICFKNTGTSCDGLTFSNCVFSGFKYAGHLYKCYRARYINCKINNGTNGLLIDGCNSAKISNCDFLLNDNHAIEFSGNISTGVGIQSCSFERSLTGIVIDVNLYSAYIADCYFESTPDLTNGVGNAGILITENGILSHCNLIGNYGRYDPNYGVKDCALVINGKIIYSLISCSINIIFPETNESIKNCIVANFDSNIVIVNQEIHYGEIIGLSNFSNNIYSPYRYSMPINKYIDSITIGTGEEVQVSEFHALKFFALLSFKNMDAHKVKIRVYCSDSLVYEEYGHRISDGSIAKPNFKMFSKEIAAILQGESELAKFSIRIYNTMNYPVTLNHAILSWCAQEYKM